MSALSAHASARGNPLLLGCSAAWSGLDFTPCYASRALNAAVPLLLLAVSALVLVGYAQRKRVVKARTEQKVGRLDPAASSLLIPGAASNVQLPAASGLQAPGASRVTVGSQANGGGDASSPNAAGSGSASGSAAALQVFRTENAVILNEVHRTPLNQLPHEKLARFRRLEALKRVLEALGACALVATHAAAWVLHRGAGGGGAGAGNNVGSGADAQRAHACWALLWLYFALLSGYTLTSRHSLYTHKALLVALYVVVSAFNLRSAVLARDRASSSPRHGAGGAEDVPLAAAQFALGLLVLLPTLFFPLKRRTPQSLLAIHRTMRQEKRLDKLRTVAPTPKRRAQRARQDAADAEAAEADETLADETIDEESGAAADARAARLLDQVQSALERGGSSSAADKGGSGAAQPPSPELYASLYSRMLFGFVTPELLTHWKLQYRPDTVPDLLPDDKAAAVVSNFRARGSATSSGNATSGSRRAQKDAANGKNGKNDKKKKKKGKSGGGRLALTLLRHFWPLLTYQFFAAALQAVLSLSSPVGLQYILAYIAQRTRYNADPARAEPPLPLHMAVLYAVLMFVGQFFFAVASSQALMTGRKICVNLRAILVTEIITKALRRRARGGAAKQKAEGEGAEEEQGKKDDKLEDESDEDGIATDGQIVNLISVDVFKVAEICAYLHFVVPIAPVQILLSLYFLTRLLGWSAVIGFAALIASIPFQAMISNFFIRVQEQLLEVTDQRLDLSTEVLNCIKTVKFFAWEKSFQARIDKIRNHELWCLQKRFVAQVLEIFCFRGLPVIIIVLTFTVHTAVFHQPLPAEVAFSSLALFTSLREAIDVLPSMLANILGSLVSVRRIDGFLREEETAKYEQLLRHDEEDDYGVEGGQAPKETRVGFADRASFTFVDDDDKIEDGTAFVLRDLDISFPPDALSIIAGPVGSGKSTLLLSLLGETRRLRGETFLPCPIARALVETGTDGLSDTVAYCSQTPWLLGTSIKENILFGLPYDRTRYRAVVKACALEPDLKILEYSDETEVGEKGTSLSGGQKARVSLARALYSTARVLLIDDALSALDSSTSEYIYRNYLKGPLVKGRTVIMVTHAVSLCMPGAAFVVALNEGRVAAQGTPAQVKAAGVFDEEGPLHLDEEAEKEAEVAEQTIEALDEGQQEAEAAEIKKKLDKKAAHAEEETYAKGAVGLDTYSLYISNFAPNAFLIVIFWAMVIALFLLSKAADVWSAAWLRRWAASYDAAPALNFVKQFFALSMLNTRVESILPLRSILPEQGAQFMNQTAAVYKAAGQTVFTSAASSPESDNISYLRIYALLSLLYISVDVIKDTAVFLGSIHASRKIFVRLMSAILNARPSFFDRTPTGRISNRIAKDMEAIDQDAADQFIFLLDVLLQGIAIFGVVIYALPIFSLLSIVIIAVYFIIGFLYVTASRDLKRIESVERSPIYTLVGEVLQGSVAIRAFGDAGRFTRQCLKLVDKTNAPFYFMWCANRWLSLRVDNFAALVSFVVALFIVLTPSIDAGLAGFTLSYSIMLTNSVLWIVRVYSNVEIQMNSVERVREYLDLEPERFAGQEPPAYWPSDKGDIVIEDLSVRYSKEFPRALDQISLEIKAGKKIGICGRTGSGKSTLALSFFRFLEAETGRITIDGIDIADVPLRTLRSRLTVIPQHPDIFSGTVRSNLDPFGTYEDADLWNALERCKLASRADVIAASRGPSRHPSRPASPGGDGDDDGEHGRIIISSLDMPVEQGGKNFSQGQRQLLALARGLLKLRDSRILILDESTASLDAASDAQIQETIRTEMSNATLITIAHRLRTICDFDMVLVLDKGKILEYDTPYALLKNEQSSFHDLAQRSGEFEHLLGMAERKHAQDAATSA